MISSVKYITIMYIHTYVHIIHIPYIYCDFFVVKIFSYIREKLKIYFYKILLFNEILVKYVSKY